MWARATYLLILLVIRMRTFQNEANYEQNVDVCRIVKQILFNVIISQIV
jgi:hypothetical protein